MSLSLVYPYPDSLLDWLQCSQPLACLVGAGLFGKISLLILLALSSCILAVFASFFLDTQYQATYHNQNVTTMGFFKGISFNSLGGINQLLNQNWESTYRMDCSNPLAEVNFFT